MNWEKCMKNFNCKICSDYKYCKDDIKAEKRKRRKKKKKTKKQVILFEVGSIYQNQNDRIKFKI